jgi:hypothetical protein
MSDKKKAAPKKVVALDAKTLAELTERLGPVKKVVKTSKAEGTDTAVVLHLECGHKRVGTKRATLRCRRCRKGAKPAAAGVSKTGVKKAPVKAAAKKKTVITVQKSGKPKVTREPVTAPTVEKTVETVASAMNHKRSHKK